MADHRVLETGHDSKSYQYHLLGLAHHLSLIHICELVGTGAPIMNIAELNDMWVTFNVREDLLKNNITAVCRK